MEFRAKLSPKQFFSFKGQKYQAVDYVMHVEDKEVIEYLEKSNFWIAGKKEIKNIEKEIKDIEKEVEQKAKAELKAKKEVEK